MTENIKNFKMLQGRSVAIRALHGPEIQAQARPGFPLSSPYPARPEILNSLPARPKPDLIYLGPGPAQAQS